MTANNLKFRYEPLPEDQAVVRKLCLESKVFSREEVAIAEELVRERLAKGPDSGYFFIFVEEDSRILGYACLGPIAGTSCSWDLYWIVVDKKNQGRGVGNKILAEVEKIIARSGGGRVYVETSSRQDYHLTRMFYEGAGFLKEAVIRKFYGPEDHKVIYVKVIVNQADG